MLRKLAPVRLVPEIDDASVRACPRPVGCIGSLSKATTVAVKKRCLCRMLVAIGVQDWCVRRSIRGSSAARVIQERAGCSPQGPVNRRVPETSDATSRRGSPGGTGTLSRGRLRSGRAVGRFQVPCKSSTRRCSLRAEARPQTSRTVVSPPARRNRTGFGRECVHFAQYAATAAQPLIHGLVAILAIFLGRLSVPDCHRRRHLERPVLLPLCEQQQHHSPPHVRIRARVTYR